MQHLSRHVALVVLMVCGALSSGCATITGSESQSILVATHDETGDAVAGAECKLSNNKSSRSVKSPGAATVRKSAEDLLVRREMEDRAPGTARVVSKMNVGMVGNVIIGGAVGVIIDHTRGTAYDYPDQVHIVFGRNRVVEGNEVFTTTAPLAASPSPASGGSAQLKDLEGLLKDQGAKQE